ncbi:hypothetical protein [Primorskyibacter marinus]|uniref:hypothetical protein n=1 Tax=Primorskyibacter marinus TaxID=1977320 RepID=UPI000E2FF579|nr:hypothetical protein [Primorskyibacter marinus]
MAKEEKYILPVLDPPETFYWGEPIDRATARDMGLKRYFTGKPCKKGHVAERHVSSACCVECTLRRHRTPEYRADMRPIYRDRYETDPEFQDRRRMHSREYWRAKNQ